MDALYGEKIREDFLEGEEGEGAALERRCASASSCSRRARSLEKTHPGEVAALARRVRALDHLLRRISLSSVFSRRPAPRLDDPVAHAEGARRDRRRIPRRRPRRARLVGPVPPHGRRSRTALPGAQRARPDRALQAARRASSSSPSRSPLGRAVGLVRRRPALGRPGRRPSSIRRNLFSSLPRVRDLARDARPRELLTLLFAPGAIARLRAERDALVAECDRLAGRVPRGG